MKEMMETIKYRDTEYALVMDINVLQDLQEKYGSFEAWAEKVLLNNGETDLGALTFGVMAMINEGIEIHNEEAGDQPLIRPITQRQAGRILTEVGLEEATEKVLSVVSASNKSAEPQSKNA